MNLTTRKFICSLLLFSPLAITYAQTIHGHSFSFPFPAITDMKMANFSFSRELKKVHLNGNNITKIDAAQFQDVELLFLTASPIEEFIGVFENLRHLVMSETSFKNLNAENFPNLETLYSIRGKLETLTGEWKELSEIFLDKNELSQINATMPKLTRASFDSNKLKVFDCVYEQLRVLYLADNELTDGNLHLSGCRNVTMLEISMNKIDVLGDEISDNLPFLSGLGARMCGLKEWHGNWPNLNSAILSRNNLSKVDASIPKINTLYLEKNELDTFLPRPFVDNVTDSSLKSIVSEMGREGVLVVLNLNLLRDTPQRKKRNATDSTPRPIEHATKKPEQTFLSQKRAPFK